MMKASESYWRALCITLGVLIGFFIFHTPATTKIQIRLEIPTPVQSIEDWGEQDVRCLRDVIYNESRNQSRAGQIAVAAVVINRTLDRRWGNTICSVTRQRGQFAARPPSPRNGLELRALDEANRIALYTLTSYAVLDGRLREYKYFNSGPARHPLSTTIGDHVFYEEYWS